MKNVFNGRIKTINIFKKRVDINLMRKTFTKEFFNIYATGLEKYIKGNWQEAKIDFEKTLNYFEGMKDGPS